MVLISKHDHLICVFLFSSWEHLELPICEAIEKFVLGTLLRMILLMMIVVCLGGTFSVEQPNNSFFEYYPGWRDFMMQLVSIGGPGSVP